MLLLAADALSAAQRLVEKWREDANAPGMGEYYQGKEHAYDACADQLAALLSERSPTAPK